MVYSKKIEIKMIKIYCDRCGNEIKLSFLKGITEEHLEKVRVNDAEYHLCPECYNSFHHWRQSK